MARDDRVRGTGTFNKMAALYRLCGKMRQAKLGICHVKTRINIVWREAAACDNRR